MVIVNLWLISTKGLPCTIGHIEANPVLKGDHTKGVALGEFPLTYEAVDDKVASGNVLFTYHANPNLLTEHNKLMSIILRFFK